MRLAAAVIAALLMTAARAQTPPGDRACVDVQPELDRALAKPLNAIELNTLLFDAARKNCAAAVTRLLQAGASRLSRNREGDTALAIAARAGRAANVAVLLNGASAAERRQLDMTDARGSTPLMLAIHSGRAALAKALLTAGADVGAANAMGETALAEAAFAGDEDIGELLLKHGAKPDTVDNYGKSPICYASARGAARLVAALLDAGVGVNARYGAKLTALMWAAGFPDQTRADAAAATVRLLISRGADLDLVDDRGRSALMIAASLNRFETARVLLAAGASRTLRDNSGKTAADLAATEEMRALLSK